MSVPRLSFRVVFPAALALGLLAGLCLITATAKAVLPPNPPINQTAPVLTGTAAVYETLTTTDGTWSPAPNPNSAEYKWKRCNNADGSSCTDIVGATSATYVLAVADYTKYIRVEVRVKKGNDWSDWVSSNVTAQVAGVAVDNTVLPSISGSATVGSTLSANNGTWIGAPAPTFSYEWLLCKAAGDRCVTTGVTASTYTVLPSDVDQVLRVDVTGTNTLPSSKTVTSAATGVVVGSSVSNATLPQISGTVRVYSTLSASTGTWNGSPAPNSFSYQWERCNNNNNTGCTNVGTNSPTYTLATSDYGKYMQVTVTASNGGGSASSLSAPTAAVAGLPLSNATLPVITGQAKVGSVLTASNGTWYGWPQPNSYAYSWQSCLTSSGSSCRSVGTNVNTYTPVSSDRYRYIAVTVTASSTLPSTASAASDFTGFVR